MSASFYKLGLRSLGLAARVLVDRLGDSELYFTATELYDQISDASYRTSADFPTDIAGEHEIASFLQKCLAELKEVPVLPEESRELANLITAYS